MKRFERNFVKKAASRALRMTVLASLFAGAFILSACLTDEDDGEGDYEDPFASAASTPTITAHPASREYVSGDTIAALSVTASVSDGGALSYQWYEVDTYTNTGGSVISNATGSTYTPSLSVGDTKNYYVKVTNTVTSGEEKVSKSKASNPAQLTMVETVTTPPAAGLTISSTKVQNVRGFGAMSNVWSSPDIQIQDIDSMFSPEKLGLNILRICIYPNQEEVIKNQDSSGQTEGRDNSDYYDIVKRVNKYGGYVLASPWTMPAEWKTNNSRTGGGHLRPEYYSTYGTYLHDYAQDMYDHGAPVYVISIQNEPNWAATYDGCEWSAEEMRDFFKQVGHFTDGVPGYGGGKAITTVLTMNGESANTAAINDAALNDADALKNIDVFARHIYGNVVQPYQLAKDKNREMWMTEHNINSGSDATYPRDSTWPYVWNMLNEVDVCMRLNDMEAFIWWYGKRFYSFVGDGQYGTSDHAILPRGYAYSHFSLFANESVRVQLTATGIDGINPVYQGATGAATDAPAFSQTDQGVKATAYTAPDGSWYSLVIFAPTDTDETGYGEAVAGGKIKVTLPSDFTATSAYAILSNKEVKQAPTPVILASDGKSAVFSLKKGEIVSVRFTK